MPNPRDRSRTPAEIWMVEGDSARPTPDELATEEPLEIRLETAGGVRTLAVTMRTPGHDRELAAGFLFCEGVVSEPADLQHFTPDGGGSAGARESVVQVALRAGLEPDLATLERHFVTSSSCGVCGKTSLDPALLGRRPAIGRGPAVSPEVLYSLPAKLRSAQGVFQVTGGLHAAGLFTAAGEPVAVREDVGRHNALDKLIGWALLDGRLPLAEQIVMVSGRASYEILQKCLMAGAPIVCAVSAPSSLAVSLARDFGVTLVGFLRERRLNVYAGRERLRLALLPG